MPFKYQPQWQGPLSGRSFEKQTEDFLNGMESRVDEIDTRQTPSDAVPMPPGVGAAGTALEYSRGDHSHPLQSSVSGNAGTADALSEAREISISGEGAGSAYFSGAADVSIPLKVSCTASGSTEDRTIADRFADIANVRDFGAKGDGTTDDTASFLAALAVSSTGVFVPEGRYVVSGAVDLNRCKGNGTLVFQTGREISLNGVMESDTQSQLFLQEIKPSSNETFQDICIIGDKIFASRETSNGVTIAQYPINFNVNTTYTIRTKNGSTAEYEYEVGLTSHGEGVHGFIDNDDIYLYVPYAPTVGAKGFYKVKWNGDSAPTYTSYVLNEIQSQGQVAVSHDGKYIVFIITTNISSNIPKNIYGNQVYIFDRLEAESNQDALPIARFNVPRSGVQWERSGADCDGRYVYMLNSNDIFGRRQSISAYDFSGTLVKSWVVDGWTACFPDDVLYGDGEYFLTDHEAEGICLYKDLLVFYAKAYFRKPAAFCKYEGVTFVAKDASTGKNPEFEPAYWTPTRATIAGAQDWDSATSYAGIQGIVHHKFICAIAPKARYSKEYPLNLHLFDTRNSMMDGTAGVLVTEHAENGILLGRKSSQTDKVLPRVLFEDGRITIYNTKEYSSSNPSVTPANFEKNASGDFLAIRSHGSGVSSGCVVYMYPCAGYSAGDSMYGAFRLWAGGTESFRSNDTASYMYRDVLPGTHNTYSLGSSALRWKNVYCQTGAFNGSDLRFKADVADPSDSLMKAWGKVNFKVFKYVDAIEEKGEDKARLHVGIIAQDIVAAFESEGLDALKYGLIGLDHIEAEYKDLDELGKEKVLVKEAHDEYIVRYSEILALEAAYQRWLGLQRDARLAALEAKAKS